MRPQIFLSAALLLAGACWPPASSTALSAAAASVRPQLTVSGLPLAHAGHEEEGSDSPQGGWRHFVSWVGHFHPPMTVFPVAMILSAALAELLLILTGASWLEGASRWCVLIGGIGGAITAALGWAFATGHDDSRLLEIHRWLGTAAGSGAIVLLVMSELARRRGGATRAAFRTLLFLAVPLFGATGFFGGAMVYGAHEYDWNPPGHESQAEPAAETTDAAPPGTASGASQLTEITMTDDESFKPDRITIPVGSIVRWKNTTDETHTVTDDPKLAANASDVSSPPGAAPFHSGKIKPGQIFEHRFTTPGTYRYVCAPHENMDMKAQVAVTAGPTSVPSSRAAP